MTPGPASAQAGSATESTTWAASTAGRRGWSWLDVAPAFGVVAALAWCYWSTLRGLWREWENPNYSVGQFVPLIAIGLVVHERARFARLAPKFDLWGLLLIGLALLVRFEGIRSIYESLERYSLVMFLAGAVWLVCGRQVFWRARWLLLFLLLMIPLPGSVQNRIGSPLQEAATAGTVFVLETFGMLVEREGYVLLLNETQRVGIEEACSGLRMLMAFMVVSAVFAFMVNRPAWQRVLLVASSFPIAILCNLVRLVVTAVLFASTSSSAAETFFHDFAGVTMMPLAVGCLLLELALMDRLILPDEKSRRMHGAAPHPAKHVPPAAGETARSNASA